jgi:hypothetical protein
MGSFALFLIAFTLSACNLDNPRAEADGYETRILAEVAATATAQATEIERQNAMINLENRHARQAELQLAWQRLIRITGLIAIPVCGYLLVYLGKFGAKTAEGLLAATVLAAETRATLIYLDEKTRTFPLLQHIHGERYLVHDPNTGGTSVLDMNNPVDRQLIASNGAVRLAGVVAREARQAEDATGVSLATNVPVIDAAEINDQLVVGSDVAKIIDVMEVSNE